jgi:hypothetical protein
MAYVITARKAQSYTWSVGMGSANSGTIDFTQFGGDLSGPVAVQLKVSSFSGTVVVHASLDGDNFIVPYVNSIADGTAAQGSVYFGTATSITAYSLAYAVPWKKGYLSVAGTAGTVVATLVAAVS